MNPVTKEKFLEREVARENNKFTFFETNRYKLLSQELNKKPNVENFISALDTEKINKNRNPKMRTIKDGRTPKLSDHGSSVLDLNVYYHPIAGSEYYRGVVKNSEGEVVEEVIIKGKKKGNHIYDYSSSASESNSYVSKYQDLDIADVSETDQIVKQLGLVDVFNDKKKEVLLDLAQHYRILGDSDLEPLNENHDSKKGTLYFGSSRGPLLLMDYDEKLSEDTVF